MRTWLQIEKERCPTRFVSGTFQGKNFGVFDSLIGVEAFSTNVAMVIGDDRTHTRIG
jgi:hypothetical protein